MPKRAKTPFRPATLEDVINYRNKRRPLEHQSVSQTSPPSQPSEASTSSDTSKKPELADTSTLPTLPQDGSKNKRKRLENPGMNHRPSPSKTTKESTASDASKMPKSADSAIDPRMLDAAARAFASGNLGVYADIPVRPKPAEDDSKDEDKQRRPERPNIAKTSTPSVPAAKPVLESLRELPRHLIPQAVPSRPQDGPKDRQKRLEQQSMVLLPETAVPAKLQAVIQAYQEDRGQEKQPQEKRPAQQVPMIPLAPVLIKDGRWVPLTYAGPLPQGWGCFRYKNLASQPAFVKTCNQYKMGPIMAVWTQKAGPMFAAIWQRVRQVLLKEWADYAARDLKEECAASMKCDDIRDLLLEQVGRMYGASPRELEQCWRAIDIGLQPFMCVKGEEMSETLCLALSEEKCEAYAGLLDCMIMLADSMPGIPAARETAAPLTHLRKWTGVPQTRQESSQWHEHIESAAWQVEGPYIKAAIARERVQQLKLDLTLKLLNMEVDPKPGELLNDGKPQKPWKFRFILSKQLIRRDPGFVYQENRPKPAESGRTRRRRRWKSYLFDPIYWP